MTAPQSRLEPPIRELLEVAAYAELLDEGLSGLAAGGHVWPLAEEVCVRARDALSLARAAGLAVPFAAELHVNASLPNARLRALGVEVPSWPACLPRLWRRRP